ncbi:MAG TPA: glutathione S-transferase, partial [Myxococcota bacterium]
MAKPLLVVGTKSKSSWSLRPWLALKEAHVDFDERVLTLDTPAFRTGVREYPPSSNRVPVLKDG